MGKQSRAKKERRQHTTLLQHKQVGKTLVPPLARVGFTLTRWSDILLPEMLWAALLFTHGPRMQVIERLRSVSRYLAEHDDDLRQHRVTLSGIAGMPAVHREWIIASLTGSTAARDVLSALLLFDDLPGRQFWEGSLQRGGREKW